ncbi:hypothetical protein LY28_02617 [Ruminiclostridium sufflavum DSM 19573]|uniref:Acetyltransferase-like isoleucine patch superfamily enzyme n=1 Tax=Ruminiclostridium sufflavum DSM 19573 TaxID=1121337 RepID=A0A318XIZ7_9FIRM|nr:DapH/DapD/GlmU-related protein [Ruminiclostridium sufflavum]PYG86994.1 hypothetical protein LY28_02617 [Ruminiclostridium sufflavum DSM 19573]
MNRLISKDALLRNVNLGKHVKIKSNSVLEEVEIGDFSHAAQYSNIYNTSIGKHCSIAPFSNINPGDERVEIGHDVKIGLNVLIMSGIKIGNGAIIEAGSIVTENVESYSVVSGEPARKVRMRFSEETIAEIEKLRWWDWDIEKIRSMFNTFRNFDEFVERNIHIQFKNDRFVSLQ